MLSNINLRNYNTVILFVPETNHKKSNATMMPGFHGVIIGFVISNRFRAP